MCTGNVKVKHTVLPVCPCVATFVCCMLPSGIIFGIPSSALLHTTLSKWVNVPAKYEGMLIDDQRKGALKKSAADVKIGPLRHCQGRHQDGDAVNCTVQVRVCAVGG